MKLENILARLVKLAKESTVNQKHAAVVLRKGVPVAFAVNSNDVHAEAAAINNYQNLATRKGKDILRE